MTSLPAPIFVDTGAIFALRNARDANNRPAQLTLASLRRLRRQLLTTNFVVAEAHALLLNRHHHASATQFLREVDASSLIVERVTGADESRARAIIYRYSDKLFTLVDTTSFAVMERLGIQEAFTFDRNFTQYGFRQPAP